MSIIVERKNVALDTIQSLGGVNLLSLSGNDLILNAPNGGDLVFQINAFDKMRYDAASSSLQLSDNGGPLRKMNVNITSFSSGALNSGTGTETLSGILPGGTYIIGISWRVVTAITGSGLTTFSLGDAGDTDRYGTGLSTALDSTGDMSDATADPGGFITADGDVVLTADAGQFDGGNILIGIHYLDLSHTT